MFWSSIGAARNLPSHTGAYGRPSNKIPAPDALCAVPFEETFRLVFRAAYVFAGLRTAADAAPLPHHRVFSEQGLDDGQPIVARHVARAIDALEVDPGRHTGIVAKPESQAQGLF
jgi:hypothetical protein